MPLNYEEAMEELQQIVTEIESENVSVDQLAGKVKRAAFLLEYCQQRLKNADDEVKKILKQMENKSKPDDIPL